MCSFASLWKRNQILQLWEVEKPSKMYEKKKRKKPPEILNHDFKVMPSRAQTIYRSTENQPAVILITNSCFQSYFQVKMPNIFWLQFLHCEDFLICLSHWNESLKFWTVGRTIQGKDVTLDDGHFSLFWTFSLDQTIVLLSKKIIRIVIDNENDC